MDEKTANVNVTLTSKASPDSFCSCCSSEPPITVAVRGKSVASAFVAGSTKM
jgi:hypothetical protein